MNGSVTSGETGSGPVMGERNTPSVNGARSLQSRISSVMAAGLMIALGVGGLSWYYASALGRQGHARQAAASAAANSAQGEMTLPPLGGLGTFRAPPAPMNSSPLVDPDRAVELPRASATSQLNWGNSGGTLPPYTGPTAYSPPRSVPEDRRLSGVAFTRDSGQPTAAAGGGLVGATGSEVAVAEAVRQLGAAGPGSSSQDGLATLLRPGATSPARAQMLPTQQFLLPKGAFIDCTLETAIDSTLPGMTTCVTATDTFGVDGKVVLLERGSKLVGETRGEVQNGAARVFVLWTEARTPTGVSVPLDSPGTDELGRSGLPGEVNRHFWDRFGAAVLVSVIDGAAQAAAQATNRGGGAVIYNPTTSADALTEVLKGTINIAPTVTKRQGDRIQILVARDLDFRTVYELRTTNN
jgi:type IV secretion system protein VirB10